MYGSSLTSDSCILTLIVTGILLGIGLANTNLLSRNISHLWSMGFGAITSESMTQIISSQQFGHSTALFLNILIANSPQPLLSFLFLTYNSLYTCMLMTSEWFDYSRERKTLRVTDPLGDQRTTYRLQLPYKYGIPLVILSGILHWLVSQSLFLVEVRSFNGKGVEDAEYGLTALGYSCIAIIFTILLGSLTIGIGLAMGFRRYDGGMPLATSCSAALSSACHQPTKDIDAAFGAVQWGVPEGDTGDTFLRVADGKQIGHCCFTSFPVTQPIDGLLYAGKGKPKRE